MITKPVIVSHSKSQLIRITGGIDSNIALSDIIEASGAELETEQKSFAQKGIYGSDMVLQRGLFIINEVGNILVSSEGNLPPGTETLLVSGSGDKDYQAISDKKLRGTLGDTLSADIFALTETSGITGTYGFVVKAILGENHLLSKIGRTLEWRSSDEIAENSHITAMERNFFHYFKAALGL